MPSNMRNKDLKYKITRDVLSEQMKPVTEPIWSPPSHNERKMVMMPAHTRDKAAKYELAKQLASVIQEQEQPNNNR